MPLAPSGLSGDGVSCGIRSKLGSSARRHERVVEEVGGLRGAVLVVDELLHQCLRRCRTRTPPCTWPATSIGLTMTPQSSQRDRAGSMVTSPVSRSTSTTESCTPNGNAEPSGWKSASGRGTVLGVVVLDSGGGHLSPRSATIAGSAGDRERSRSRRRGRCRRGSLRGAVGGDVLRLLDQPLARLHDGRAADLQRSRPAGAVHHGERARCRRGITSICSNGIPVIVGSRSGRTRCSDPVRVVRRR